jgi:rhodanese-related sulfurtransferase
VHCASGGRSGRSLEIFRDLGFTRIYHMNDGFKGWMKEKLPSKKGKPEKNKK